MINEANESLYHALFPKKLSTGSTHSTFDVFWRKLCQSHRHRHYSTKFHTVGEVKYE